MAAIITKEIIKSDWLGRAVNDTTLDAAIDRWILQAAGIAKSICKQPISQETITKYFDGPLNGCHYRTGYTSPVSLTSLSYRQLPTDSWTAISSSFLAVDKTDIYYTNGFPDLQYKLVCDVGYTSSNVPADIIQAYAVLVVSAYKRSNIGESAGSIGVSSITLSRSGETTTTITMKDVTPEVKALLQPYTVIWL